MSKDEISPPFIICSSICPNLFVQPDRID